MIGNQKVEYDSNGLKRLIEGYDAVSFDVFDTLVMRKLYFNRDVFLLTARKFSAFVPDFFEVRVRAERVLSETRYPYIEEIYDYIMREKNVSGDLIKRIMDYEIEVERNVIIPRNAVVDIFEHCKKTGKKTYIVSDMYIHRRELENIINNVGIVGYDDIFVSCEYGTSKTQHLFECYKEKVNAPSYLHIGDSFLCDIDAAAKAGIESFRLKTSAEVYESTGACASEDLEERSRQAEYISKKYNSPFS